MKFDEFLSKYDDSVYKNALLLRKLLLAYYPGIIEQVDLPAKMVAYCYGQRYIDMICTIIPSKKGLKLGFYKGVELPDPDGLLRGTGKISRYIEIKSPDQINSSAVKELISNALVAYKQRMSVKK